MESPQRSVCGDRPDRADPAAAWRLASLLGPAAAAGEAPALFAVSGGVPRVNVLRGCRPSAEAFQSAILLGQLFEGVP